MYVCVCVHAWQSRTFPATWWGSERQRRSQGWLIWPMNRMVPGGQRRRTQCFRGGGLVTALALIMRHLLGYVWWGRRKVGPRSPRGEKIEPTKWQLKIKFYKNEISREAMRGAGQRQKSASLWEYSLVAADAFVPSSFTSILAFCRAFDTYTGSAPEETNGVWRFSIISWQRVLRLVPPPDGARGLKTQQQFPRKRLAVPI